MDRHLEPAPEPADEDLPGLGEPDEGAAFVRPPWWRWVAVVVVVSLVVATPFIYVLSRVFG